MSGEQGIDPKIQRSKHSRRQKAPTSIKLRHRRLTLPRVLQLRKLLVRIVRLDVVPRVELEDVVALLQIPRPERKRVRPLLVVCRIVRAVCRFADRIEGRRHSIRVSCLFFRGFGHRYRLHGHSEADMLHALWQLLPFRFGGVASGIHCEEGGAGRCGTTGKGHTTGRGCMAGYIAGWC